LGGAGRGAHLIGKVDRRQGLIWELKEWISRLGRFPEEEKKKGNGNPGETLIREAVLRTPPSGRRRRKGSDVWEKRSSKEGAETL